MQSVPPAHRRGRPTKKAGEKRDVRCPCGQLLTGHCSGAGRYRRRYYLCRYHPLDPGTKRPAHPADRLEAAFLGILRRLTADPDLVVRRQNPDLQLLRKHECEITERITRLREQRAAAWNLSDALSGAQLRERLDELDATQERAERDLREIRAALTAAREAQSAGDSIGAILRDLAQVWPDAPVDNQQEIARAIAAILGGFVAVDKGELQCGHDVATQQLADVIRSVATVALLSACRPLRTARRG